METQISRSHSSYLKDTDKMPIFINSLPVEEVLDFKHLGSAVIPNGLTKDEITT